MLDPTQINAIDPPETRSLVRLLANLYEQVHADNQTLRDEISRLSQETHRLTAELGNLQSSADKSAPLQRGDYPAQESTGQTKRSAQTENGDTVLLNRTVTVLGYDNETMPSDAHVIGEESAIVQDLKISPYNTGYQRLRYHSPATGTTYLASLPPGSEGGFGHDLKALVVRLHLLGDVSQPALLRLLTQVGVKISDAQLWTLLDTTLDALEQEEQQIAAEATPYPRRRSETAARRTDEADPNQPRVGQSSYFRYATAHETEHR